MTSNQTDITNNSQTQSLSGDHILSVLGEAAAEGTMRDLTRSGHAGAQTFRGETAAAELNSKGEYSGPLGKMVKVVHDHLSEETNYLAQYEEEARNGNVVIAIPIKEREAADEVRDLLERHGARNIRLFGNLAVTDLSPLTNPSLRSDDSPEQQARDERQQH